MIPVSLLDLSPILEGGDAADALRRSLDLARHAERFGYRRFWMAEHHGIRGVASSATAVALAHVAGGTRTIRVGSGGVMLPNHAPLVIAEQFGTLESLFPGRIDLGLGRAPGGDRETARALRRDLDAHARAFPNDVRELRGYFSSPAPGQSVQAVPGAGLRVPLYLLGSSDFSARVAGELGLPFAFASHFAPDFLRPALAIYRESFQPSEQLAAPHAMVAANLVAAGTDAEAARLLTSAQQAFLNLVRGRPGPLPPPVETMADRWNPFEEAQVRRMMRCSAIGSPETVRGTLESLLDDTRADELVFTGQIFDHAARVRSFEIGAEVARRLEPRAVPSAR